MKVSTRARYAIRLMLDVSRHSRDGSPVSLADVAQRTDLSRGYLEQLATSLRSRELLKGIMGKQGGYRLGRPAEGITLRDVVEAVIGPIAILDCPEDVSTCLRAESCVCRSVYADINQGVSELLNGYSLADLRDGVPDHVFRPGTGPAAREERH